MEPAAAAKLQAMSRRRCSRFVAFLADDRGQDIVEYALLAAFIGVAGWAALSLIDNAVGTTYASWLDPANGVPSLWEPADPTGAGS